MIQITLKAKHYYFIVNHLQNIVASRFFHLLKDLQEATQNVADEDEVTITATVDDLVEVFSFITNKPEGQVYIINAEMKALLNQQIQAGMAANDPEWINAAIQINSIRIANLAVTQQAIAAGKLFLHPQSQSQS